MHGKKATLIYHDLVNKIDLLEPEEQISLAEIIFARLKGRVSKGKIKKHNIMELEGLGAEIWNGIDAQEYVSQERSSWD